MCIRDSLYTAGKNISVGDSSGSTDDRITFGDSADLSIFHNGSNNYIDVAGTGYLYVRPKSNFYVQNYTTGDVSILAIPDGAVELYYDNSKKFNTMSSGVAVTGDIDIANGSVYLRDNYKLRCGTGSDLQIYHDGSNSYLVNTTGELQLRDESRIKLRTDQFVLNNHANDESIIYAGANGNVELYYNGSKKLETTSDGAKVTGSGLALDVNGGYIRSIGGGPSIVAHKSSNTFCHIGVENDSTARAFLAYTNDKAFIIGRRTAYTGDNTGYSGADITIDSTNHAVQLNYNGSKKFETTSTGVTVTGTVSDSKGNLRSIPRNNQSSAYTLVAADAGKCITAAGNITVNNSVFAEGDAVSIIADTGSTISIVQGSGVTMYNTGDASTGSKTLAARGMCTIWFVAANNCYLSGAGLS